MHDYSLSGSKSGAQQALAPLHPEMQKYVDVFLEWVIGIEKKHYHNEMIPFEKHAEQMKAKGQQIFVDYRNQFQHAQTVLKDHFEMQERGKGKLKAYADASYSIWEEAVSRMRKKIQDSAFVPSIFEPLQEQMSIPWAWMDRAYQVANDLLAAKRYDDAQDVYLFLSNLQPAVFEYWFGVATCQHVLGKYEEAANTYSICLLFQPENALIFFQLADCFFQGREKECGMQTLEYCIEYAQKDEQYKDLHQEAVQLKRSLEIQR